MVFFPYPCKATYLMHSAASSESCAPRMAPSLAYLGNAPSSSKLSSLNDILPVSNSLDYRIIGGQKKGFRALRRRELRARKDEFRAMRVTCSGCGAEVVFPESEVLQSCSFCGRALHCLAVD